MAKAYRAPMDTYAAHLSVSEHAVQRFRERARDFLEQGGFLSDEAVSNQIDFAVWDAMSGEDRCFDIVDSTQPSKLVHIESESWGSLWALVRENRIPRVPHKWVVITLLTDWQMTQNALDGRYQGNVPRLPQFAKHFEAAARPKLVVPPRPPAPVPPAPALVQEPAPALALAPAAAATAASAPGPVLSASATPEGTAPKGTTPGGGTPERIALQPAAPPPGTPGPDPATAPRSTEGTNSAGAPIADDDRRLLVYPDPGGELRYETLARSDVGPRVAALCASGLPLARIQIWRPAAFRIEVD